MQISSLQNPTVKSILQLQEKPRERRNRNLTVVEGIREVTLALDAGYVIEQLLVCPDWLPEEDFQSLFPTLSPETVVLSCTPTVFNRLVYRKESGGILACIRTRRHPLSSLRLPDNPLILVLESVEKPGNLGAIFRTTDAAGVSAIIVCDPQTDLYNPNTIRASLGTLFTSQIAMASAGETLRWLQEKRIKSFAAALPGQRFYHEADFTAPCAIVMGSEATGLTGSWLSGDSEIIQIPMRGKADSLNVSVSAAILVFEAMRQRQFPGHGR